MQFCVALIASPYRQTLGVWSWQWISDPSLPTTKRNPKFPLIILKDGSQQDVTDLSPSRVNGYPETSERPARFVAKRITQMMPIKALYKVSASMKLDYRFKNETFEKASPKA